MIDCRPASVEIGHAINRAITIPKSNDNETFMKDKLNAGNGEKIQCHIKVSTHSENLPMQYSDFFSAVKIENFFRLSFIFFLFLLKIYIVDTC